MRAYPSNRLALAISLAYCAAWAACAGDTEILQVPQAPSRVILERVAPELVLPNSRVWVIGTNFSAQATHELMLDGVLGARQSEARFQAPIELIDGHGEWKVDPQLLQTLGEGQFVGRAIVRSRNKWGESQSAPLSVVLDLRRAAQPTVSAVGDGVVYLNSDVKVEGSGLLQGRDEGQTRVELKGCVLPEGVSGSCAAAGDSVEAVVDLDLDRQTDRGVGTFRFAPTVMGIEPGRFEGTMVLVNDVKGREPLRSDARNVRFDLLKSRVVGFEQPLVSLGQYLVIQGNGFVGASGTDATMVLRFAGTFAQKGGQARSVNFDLVPGFSSGTRTRYVVEEANGLGEQIDLRNEAGTLSGEWTPTVNYRSKRVTGEPRQLSLNIGAVRQLFWVRFTSGWTESLRRFGLQAADRLIRERVIAVLSRTYGGLNVEFRMDEPKDFKLYAMIEITGSDPNGQALLGYDNTQGKDTDNKRLHDRIGGVNAHTQEDGFPGYGGVFVESMLGFSEHPPSGVPRSPLHTSLFDRVFDPFRPNIGRELTSTEAISAPPVVDGRSCPAVDRGGQAACAIYVLGNLVGNTAGHEAGHSLGLADPHDQLGRGVFHNRDDLPNRLMDSGSFRSFTERAELKGDGPAIFCAEAFEYLRGILPSAKADSVEQRPSCF